MSCVCLQRSSGHVLGEIPVPGCNDDDVMPLVRARLSWCVKLRGSSTTEVTVEIIQAFAGECQVPVVQTVGRCEVLSSTGAVN